MILSTPSMQSWPQRLNLGDGGTENRVPEKVAQSDVLDEPCPSGPEDSMALQQNPAKESSSEEATLFAKGVTTLCMAATIAGAFAPVGSALGAGMARNFAPQASVTYVMPGTARIELYQNKEQGPDGKAYNKSHTPMGVDLGGGIVLDSNGNMSVLTQEGGEITGFKSLENTDGTRDATLQATRDGDVVKVRGPYGQRANFQEQDGGASIRGHEGHYFVRYNNSFGRGYTSVVGGTVMKTDQFHINWEGNTATIKLPDARTFKVTGEKDSITITDANGATREYPLTPRHPIGQDLRITVDREMRMALEDSAMKALEGKLEKLEPGFVRKHPITMAIVGQAMKDTDFAALVKANEQLNVLEGGALISTGVSMGNLTSALIQEGQALSLASRAMQLKDAAMAAKGAAMAASKAGNLAQAGAYANQAKNLAAQATTTGAQAKEVGHSALKAGHAATNAMIAGGALAILDGAWTSYKGFDKMSNVKEGYKVAASALQRVAEEEDGETFKYAQADYERVTATLHEMMKSSEGTIVIGGVKISMGTAMVVGALCAGPAAPIVGGVAAAIYAGFSIYDSFFREDPRLDLNLPQAK